MAEDKSATLYRMVLPEETCPFGVRAKQMLEENGYTIDEHILRSRSEVDYASSAPASRPHRKISTMIQSMTELDRVRRDCRRLVTGRSLLSASAVVVPLPGADIAADIGLLTTLLPQISKRFELDHEQIGKLDPRLAQQVLVIASGLGNNVIGRMVTKKLVIRLLQRFGVRIATASAAKYVPIVGSAIAATIGFGAMKMVGNAHIEDCYRTAKALIDAQSLPPPVEA